MKIKNLPLGMFGRFFTFYKDKFLRNVKKVMSHLPNDSFACRIKVWLIVSGAFFQRKAEDESEIWSGTFRYPHHEAIQIQAMYIFVP